jgi:hypothetical protein
MYWPSIRFLRVPLYLGALVVYAKQVPANLTYPSPARQATQSRCAVSDERIAERLVGWPHHSLPISLGAEEPGMDKAKLKGLSRAKSGR